MYTSVQPNVQVFAVMPVKTFCCLLKSPSVHVHCGLTSLRSISIV